MNLFLRCTFFCCLLSGGLHAQTIVWITDCADKMVCMNQGSCTEGNVSITEKASTTCGNPALNYSYRIDLFDNGSMDVQSNLDTITGTLPAGSHRVSWRATNACGVVSNCTYVVTVKDCQPPNLLCINGLTQGLDAPDCQAAFVASQFVLGKSDNCSPAGSLQLGMRKSGEGTGFPEQDTVHFDECDLGLNFLEVWVKDVNGLTNLCQTYVLIQENNSGCNCNPDGDIQMTGCARSSDNQKLSTFTVEAKTISTAGVQPPLNITKTQTSTDSCFSLQVTQLPFEADYTTVVRAYRSDEAVSGVTTFDLVKMSRHILNLEPFENIYQVLAADVNNSNTVSTFDIVETRKVILGINDTFPMVPLWRFVRPVANPSNLDGLSAVRDTYLFVHNDLLADLTYNNLNFIGVKMGDVNASASFIGDADDRNQQPPLVFLADDHTLIAGETLDVPVYPVGNPQVSGWQMALEYDPAALRVLAIDGLPAEYYNISPADGAIRMLWYDAQGKTFSEQSPVLHLRVEALRPVQLSQVLQWNPTALRAEACNEQGKRALQWRYKGATAPDVLTVSAPAPNPFAETTQFRVTLAEKSDVHLRLFQHTGALLFEQRYALDAGTHTITPAPEVFPAAGMYTYQLECGGKMYSGKVVKKR